MTKKSEELKQVIQTKETNIEEARKELIKLESID